MNNEYIPRDDESEAKQYAKMQGTEDIKYLSDDDVRLYSINDFGLNLQEDAVREDFR